MAGRHVYIIFKTAVTIYNATKHLKIAKDITSHYFKGLCIILQ